MSTRQERGEKRVYVSLSPHERLVLETMAREHEVSVAELLRIGMRLLWRLHRQNRFQITPRIAWRPAAGQTIRRKETRRRNSY